MADQQLFVIWQDQENVDNVSIAIQTADLSTDEAADATIIDPDASFNVSSLYHGAWPISPLKKGIIPTWVIDQTLRSLIDYFD